MLNSTRSPAFSTAIAASRMATTCAQDLHVPPAWFVLATARAVVPLREEDRLLAQIRQSEYLLPIFIGPGVQEIGVDLLGKRQEHSPVWAKQPDCNGMRGKDAKKRL